MKNKRFVYRFRSVLILILVSFPAAFAAFEDLESSTAHSAMAGAGVAQQIGPASIFINPALLHNLKGTASGFYHPFGIAEIKHISGVVAHPIGKMTSGLAITAYGNKYYSEQQFQTTVTWQLTSKFIIAASGTAGTVSIKNYGNDWTLWLNAGCLYRLSKKLVWGTCIKNLNYACIGQNREPVPHILQSGFCFSAHPSITVNLDVYKDSYFPLDVISGISYAAHSMFSLRFGIGSEPSRFAAGFSLLILKLGIDYAYVSKIDVGDFHLFTVQFFQRRNSR